LKLLNKGGKLRCHKEMEQDQKERALKLEEGKVNVN